MEQTEISRHVFLTTLTSHTDVINARENSLRTELLPCGEVIHAAKGVSSFRQLS